MDLAIVAIAAIIVTPLAVIAALKIQAKLYSDFLAENAQIGGQPISLLKLQREAEAARHEREIEARNRITQAKLRAFELTKAGQPKSEA